MARLFIPFLLFFGILGVVSCHKKDNPTVINGTVVDAKTGMPLEGVYIYGGIFDGPNAGANISKVTGTDGKFFIKFSHTGVFSGLTIVKDGYMEKLSFGADVDFEYGRTNDIQVKLYPEDGVLRFNFENTQVQQDSIYVGCYVPLYEQEFPLAKGIIYYEVVCPTPQSSVPKISRESTNS